MLTYPQINPVAVHLGPLQVHWYGIMYVIGFALAWCAGGEYLERAGCR
jgi:phosphatidylglycerol---prolipoprotein diacylglyceryl transferase